MRSTNLRRASLALALALLIWTPTPATAQDGFRSWVLATFDDTPEGLAIDDAGNIYAALFHTGRIVRIAPDGSEETIAWVPSQEESGQGHAIGIDLDAHGNIYVAYREFSERWEETELFDPFHASCRDATVTRSGVYKIDAQTREVTALATKAEGWPFCFPDDVDIDRQGNVYMTDITYAGIWKISPDGTDVTLWSADPLLNWSPQPYSGIPLGVNVIVLDAAEENVYVATDGEPMVLKIPIEADGSAGEVEIVARGYSPFDGIEFDDAGNIYVSEVLRNEIWVLAPASSRQGPAWLPLQRALVADASTAPLDNPTSLIWHDGVVCTANLGFLHPTPQDADRTVVCVEGFELPGE